MQRHGYRGTVDVDAFYSSGTAIDSIIRKIGDEFGINRPNELWLNNSISNLNPEPRAEHCETIYQFSNLVVKAVNIAYLVGMKLTVARKQDVEDVASILNRENDDQPLELMSRLDGMGFDIDISILLDAYEKAHGMDWLNDFYVNNQVELRKYV